MRNFKRICPIAVFCILCYFLNMVMSYMLVPYNYVQVDVHNIETNAYDDIFVGTSHGFSAIDPEIISKKTGNTAVNLCLGGEYLRDSYYLLKDACRTSVPKRVIYELDPGYWVAADEENDSYMLAYRAMSFSTVKIEYFFAKIMESDFRSALFPWFYFREQYSNVKNIIATKQSDAYKNYSLEPFQEQNQSLQEGGFMSIVRHENENKLETNLKIWTEDHVQDEKLEYFKKLVQFCNKKGIELIVITTPIPQETLDKYSVQFTAANQYFAELMKEYGLEYYNFNEIEMEGFNNSISEYSDYDGHMYGDTAEKFSEILGDYLSYS